MNYRPRRANKRWIEGAPEYVLSCHDNKGKTMDRYTVFFGGSLWNSGMGYNVYYLDMSETPGHPGGVSSWGECLSMNRTERKIRWIDLPQNIREHVIVRVNESAYNKNPELAKAQ